MGEQDAFYVVRKGNMVAVYSTLKDCQDQVSPSVCDPAISAYKGYSLRTETEAYLATRGLKNALYTIDATDVKEDLFGTLLPCSFQDVHKPNSGSVEQSNNFVNLGSPKMPELAYRNHHEVEALFETQPLFENHLNEGSCLEAQPISNKHMQCILEFDGASKGNPGKSGAGAVIRTADEKVVAVLREGLGVVTNNVAEYKALILGLKYALKKGFKEICVQGDSQLVCMQVQGLWQTKNSNMIELCKEVKELKENFLYFKINHVKREHNAFADVQANLAINLPVGEVHEECGKGF